MVKEPKKTICDTCALKWRKYEFSDISGHTVGISRKTVNYFKKTTYNSCLLKWRKYEFSDISSHTVVIIRKLVK